jgi:hypothetical protein
MLYSYFADFSILLLMTLREFLLNRKQNASFLTYAIEKRMVAKSITEILEKGKNETLQQIS